MYVYTPIARVHVHTCTCKMHVIVATHLYKHFKYIHAMQFTSVHSHLFHEHLALGTEDGPRGDLQDCDLGWNVGGLGDPVGQVVLSGAPREIPGRGGVGGR